MRVCASIATVVAPIASALPVARDRSWNDAEFVRSRSTSNKFNACARADAARTHVHDEDGADAPPADPDPDPAVGKLVLVDGGRFLATGCTALCQTVQPQQRGDAPGLATV